ncbi:MAG TPA: NAD-dependent epimerase/dehydratase family protein [Ignavibacteria bacterium]|nr:NAD-dependent epimerase/dehydratase family protein [Ignavibacteria bacterium]HRJ99708.1 NAD-dependent epimerase/dehydratase family protein [Ignavibacteria bacterium]
MKKERCIIYGGGGFIGSHLCDKLLGSGYDVTVFDKLNFSKKNIQHIQDQIKIIEGDFNNEFDLINSLQGVDYVFHLVSTTLPASSNDNPEYDAETNLISSLKLFKECVALKIKKIIFLSSGGTVYGIPSEIPVKENYSANPVCSYGIIKRTIEEYLFLYNYLYGQQYYVFRLSNPYGERQNPNSSQGAIGVFLSKVIKNETIEIWGDGETVRDYIYVKDAVEVLAKSVSADTDVRVFNLSTGIGHTLNQIVETIGNVSGKKITPVFKKARKLDVPVNILDNSKVKNAFGWKPLTSIEEGIKNTFDYLIQQGKQ